MTFSHGHHHHEHDHDHDHDHEHHHGHSHSHDSFSGYFSQYKHHFTSLLQSALKDYSSTAQSYIGAFITSSASFPIFILLIIFNPKNILILNALSAFAAGGLLGEVFLHSIPDLYTSKDKPKHPLLTNELLICFGVILFFFVEKFLLTVKDKLTGIVAHSENQEHSHSHSSESGRQIVITVIGDFVHNSTDGLAIAAGFAKSFELGIIIVTGIFFHELPHEIGDFSYMLKKKLSVTKTFIMQIISASGSFLGVFLFSVLGTSFQNEVLAFSSGVFIYIALTTILSELKDNRGFVNLIFECICFLLGIYLMLVLA